VNPANAAIIIIAIAGGLAAGHFADRRPEFGYWWYGSCAVLCAVLTVLDLVSRQWGWAAWLAVLAVLNVLLWLDSRRKRRKRRTLAALGAKSRARIAAMTARMRQRQPRPVLRPVPL
jgi:hypothetical protein